MPSLVDQFCPNVHDAAITAAAVDPWSGAVATADSTGLVAVQRQGESSPGLFFRPGAGVNGGLALIRGGSLIAVGDEDGTIGVYSCVDGSEYFKDAREGARGRVRAMRGTAISPEGSLVAAIAKDGLLRLWDMTRNERNAWRGFWGESVAFDARGERLLAMNTEGQPQLIDLLSLQTIYMDRLQTPAERAVFTLDGTHVVAAGPAGISLLRVADGALVASFATQGGSGIINLILSPDGQFCGAVTHRSVHQFSLPDLSPVDSLKHGAPNPTGAAAWTWTGIKVAGDDGLMHSGQGATAGPVTGVAGFGEIRVALHGERAAIWRANKRIREIPLGGAAREVHVDRDGRLLASLPERGSVAIFDLESGKKAFEPGPETAGSPGIAVGGNVLAVMMPQGGLRWWDLGFNKGFELKWPIGMALSGGGTWLGVITPKGQIKILDPATGKEIMAAPTPSADIPARLLSFVNRRPDMLVLDAEGVLTHYDLSAAAQGGPSAKGRDLLSLNVPVDRLWGITGGQRCALRLPEDGRASILFVELQSGNVVSEVRDLHPGAWVDAENGTILEPARSSAILERDPSGEERAVYRALVGGEWLSFHSRGMLATSPNAGAAL